MHQIIGVPEEDEKKKREWENIWRDYTENFPNMGKEIVSEVQEAQESHTG